MEKTSVSGGMNTSDVSDFLGYEMQYRNIKYNKFKLIRGCSLLKKNCHNAKVL